MEGHESLKRLYQTNIGDVVYLHPLNSKHLAFLSTFKEIKSSKDSYSFIIQKGGLEFNLSKLGDEKLWLPQMLDSGISFSIQNIIFPGHKAGNKNRDNVLYVGVDQVLQGIATFQPYNSMLAEHVIKLFSKK